MEQDDGKQQEQALNENLTDEENQEIDNNGKIDLYMFCILRGN